MGRHAESLLYEALRSVEGLTAEEAERRVSAYRREVLSRFTNSLTEELHDLRRAWTDDDGRMLPFALPIFNLITEAILKREDALEAEEDA